jgi:Uncharacterised nucleotidyltransferase
MSRTLHRMMLRTLNLTKGEPGPLPWDSFTQREWDFALAWLDLSGLAIYFHERTRSADGLHALPGRVREELEKRRAGNRLRNEAILDEFRTFIGAFEQAGVKYAVLKGISLLPDYCPEMEFRTQYDHDVLVAPESLSAARRVLESAGFHAKIEEGESPLIYRRAEPEIRFSQKSDALYSPRLGRSIDLHQTFWEEGEERIHVSLSNDFLERGQLRCWEGISFRALRDEDSLLFQILHAFKHILRNWCRVSVFLEIAWFVNRRSADFAFWQSFARRIENVRWAREATFIVFTLSEQLFGAVIPAPLRVSLSSPLAPALHLWIERYGQHSAVSNFHDDKCSLFLHREFIDDPSDWAMIRRRRLFPWHRPHRPPAVVFQRGFSALGKMWMEKTHALRRLRFHGLAGLRYALEYPRWIVLRRMRLAESGNL